VLGFLAIGRIWSAGFESVSTFLGLLSAGLAIALQDPIVIRLHLARDSGAGDLRERLEEGQGDPG
jgi:hypothetical protein